MSGWTSEGIFASENTFAISALVSACSNDSYFHGLCLLPSGGRHQVLGIITEVRVMREILQKGEQPIENSS